MCPTESRKCGLEEDGLIGKDRKLHEKELNDLYSSFCSKIIANVIQYRRLR
jgi:hypothetical protein